MGQSINRCATIVFSLGLCLSAWASGSDVGPLIERAEARAAEGRYAEASSLLKQALAEAPDSSLAHTRLGGVALLQQHYREGIEHFQQAISLEQENAQAFIGMAIGYLHLGQYELAKAALNEAESLDPGKKPEIDKLLSWLEQRSAGFSH